MVKWLHNLLYPEQVEVIHLFVDKTDNYSFQPTPTGERALFVGYRRSLAAGQYVILPNESGTTRYQIIGIKYYSETSPMFKAYLKFAPREYAR